MRIKCINIKRLLGMIGIVGCIGTTLTCLLSMIAIYFFDYNSIIVSDEIFFEIPLVICVLVLGVYGLNIMIKEKWKK